jgi:hypothetical protein
MRLEPEASNDVEHFFNLSFGGFRFHYDEHQLSNSITDKPLIYAALRFADSRGSATISVMKSAEIRR